MRKLFDFLCGYTPTPIHIHRESWCCSIVAWIFIWLSVNLSIESLLFIFAFLCFYFISTKRFSYSFFFSYQNAFPGSFSSPTLLIELSPAETIVIMLVVDTWTPCKYYPVHSLLITHESSGFISQSVTEWLIASAWSQRGRNVWLKFVLTEIQCGFLDISTVF